MPGFMSSSKFLLPGGSFTKKASEGLLAASFPNILEYCQAGHLLPPEELKEHTTVKVFPGVLSTSARGTPVSMVSAPDKPMKSSSTVQAPRGEVSGQRHAAVHRLPLQDEGPACSTAHEDPTVTPKAPLCQSPGRDGTRWPCLRSEHLDAPARLSIAVTTCSAFPTCTVARKGPPPLTSTPADPLKQAFSEKVVFVDENYEDS